MSIKTNRETDKFSISTIRVFTILASLILLTSCKSLSTTPSSETQTNVDNADQKFRCTNNLEVQCEDQSCTSSNVGEFTPMDVNFDGKDELSVCAYSGCWEGHAEVLSADPILVLTGNAFPFSSNTGNETANIVVVLDSADMIGTIKVGTFAQPLICSLSSEE